MAKLGHVDADKADATALRCVQNGTADADQQRRAMRWILEKACQIGGFPFMDTDRDTAFECGRLYVGKEIGRLLICDLGKLRGPGDVRVPNVDGRR